MIPLIKQAVSKIRDLWRRDPWLMAKYVCATLLLGAVGKAMLVGAKDGADVPNIYAQFVPTVPMMMLTFLVHRHLWKHPKASFTSYIGRHWTASYGVQFVVGHGLFTVFTVLLGWYYLGVSVTVGVASALVTFTYNEWRIFKRHKSEAETA